MFVLFTTLSVQNMEKESDLSTIEKLIEISPPCFEQEEDVVLSIEKSIAQGHIDVNDLEIVRRQKKEQEIIVRGLTPLVELVVKLEEFIQQETLSESEDLGTLSLAEKYKDAYLITQLPEESLLIANQSLVNSIKILMKLRMLNKDLNQAWTVEKIGTLCKNYSDDDKDEMLGKLFAYRDFKPTVYMPLAILFSLGFGTHIGEINDFVLEKVVGKAGFLPVLQLLFKNKANPNLKIYNAPLFFKLKTVEEAQVFVENNVDFNPIFAYYQSNWGVNVLWCTVLEEYPLELMKFYLDHEVDPKVLNHRGECLLHELADKFCLIKDMDDYFKKFELLLDAIPDMINLLSLNHQTPTGELMRIAQQDCENGYTLHCKEMYDKFIALFRERGGRTFTELQPWYKEGMPKI